MGELIRIDDFKWPWHEVFTVDSTSSTLQVYVNTTTGAAEIVQMNDEGEAIRTALAPTDAVLLALVLASKTAK